MWTLVLVPKVAAGSAVRHLRDSDHQASASCLLVRALCVAWRGNPCFWDRFSSHTCKIFKKLADCRCRRPIAITTWQHTMPPMY
jgi:hypothetical protein